MTEAEIIAMRTLRTEQREGVTHFITGQQGARMMNDVHAQLSYVDIMGYLVIMPCRRDERSEWAPMDYLLRAGQFTAEVVRTPRDFELSAKMIAALEQAWTRRQSK